MPFKNKEDKKSWQKKYQQSSKSRHKCISMPSPLTNNYLFSGKNVNKNKENEFALLQYRVRKLERIVVKARLKSLMWLYKKAA